MADDPPLLAVELEACSVRLGRRFVLRDVSFTLNRGERWLLHGANGAGKTVLLKLLRGDVWPTPTGREARRYRFANGEVDADPRFAFGRIAYLGPERQDRYDRRESTLTVEQVVLTGFDDSDFPLAPATAVERRRIATVLGRVGLRRSAARPFLSLSYGQRRRALLARALVRRPDVLLLDEALNGLDAAARRAFVRTLRTAVPATTAWILSTHRADDVHGLGAVRRATLVDGRLVPDAPPHDHTPAARPRRGRAAALRGTRATAPLFRVERATVHRGTTRVIGAFDWTLRPGEHWHLRGANGAGKSTLVALLHGDLWPAHGARLERRWRAVEDWKRRIGLVSPELQATFARTRCTVREIVGSGLHGSVGLERAPSTAARRRVERTLADFGLEALASRRARELSYGQLRLVLVARAFVRPRRLLLLDEPFDGLDAVARDRLRRAMEAAVRRDGATLVIATHHVEDVPDCVRCELELRPGCAPRARARRGARRGRTARRDDGS